MKSESLKRKLKDELEKVTLGMHLAKLKRGMARHILCIRDQGMMQQYTDRD